MAYNGVVVRSTGLISQSEISIGQITRFAFRIAYTTALLGKKSSISPIRRIRITATHLDVDSNVLGFLPLQGVLDDLEVLVVLGVCGRGDELRPVVVMGTLCSPWMA